MTDWSLYEEIMRRREKKNNPPPTKKTDWSGYEARFGRAATGEPRELPVDQLAAQLIAEAQEEMRIVDEHTKRSVAEYRALTRGHGETAAAFTERRNAFLREESRRLAGALKKAREGGQEPSP